MRSNNNFIFGQFHNHTLYVNALLNRPDGRFILSNVRRLEKNLRIYFGKQMRYVLDSMKGEFPVGDSKNSLQKNTTKKELKKITDNLPYQKEVADEIVLYMGNSIERGAKKMIAQKALGRFGIGWTTVNKKAADYLGKKLSHELSDYKGNIHHTTVDGILRILYDSYEQGRSYQETSKLIQEQGQAGVFSQARGELIATREIGVAYEQGNYLPIQSLKEENPDRDVKKYWSTVGDSHVTPPHAENEDFGWVELDFIYEPSGGDEHAPGSDNPRCRCTQLYDIH